MKKNKIVVFLPRTLIFLIFKSLLLLGRRHLAELHGMSDVYFALGGVIQNSIENPDSYIIKSLIVTHLRAILGTIRGASGFHKWSTSATTSTRRCRSSVGHRASARNDDDEDAAAATQGTTELGWGILGIVGRAGAASGRARAASSALPRPLGGIALLMQGAPGDFRAQSREEHGQPCH